MLDGSISQATDHITELQHNSDVVGLKINFCKTKFMSNYPTQNEIQLADGSSIKQVDEFKYLGSLVSHIANDINARKGQAWAD